MERERARKMESAGGIIAADRAYGNGPESPFHHQPEYYFASV